MGLYSSSRGPLASALLLCFCMLFLGVHGGSRRVSTPVHAWDSFYNLNPILLRHLQLYIVYLGDVKHGHPNDVIASHHDLLSNVLGRYVASFQLGRACYLLIFLKINFEKNDMQADKWKF